MKLRVGDTVLVTKGRNRGSTGQIQQVFSKQRKALVEGVNVVQRHTKATQNVRQAGIVQKEMPIAISNLRLICPHTQKPTRVGYTVLTDGTKARVSKVSEEVIE